MKVLIVEDDSVHRSYLKEAIEAALPECEMVIEAAHGHDGERLSREHNCLHLVMDLQMPRRTGVEAARVIWSERPETAILFWSNYADEAYVRGVSRIVPEGAAYGYILKSASEDRLRLALRSIFIENQCVIDREIRTVQQKASDRSQGVTDAEYEVLLDVALGLTDRLIARRRNLSLRSVQNRLQQLYDKLGVYDSAVDQAEEAFNLRTRALCIAFLRRLVNRTALEQAEVELAQWLARQGRH
ncbi:two component transcriptional regulator, LuxR family [Pseudoxanthobacter soli DSM 19599]|uniref:Two component transcriptional regulator, LuxR family n=1 Tax=Pseudoxanthobacter soli DSM 19599 TaxID=1123029 RepID=A0A1M7ZNC1_9HYPH|nr:response regulator transcription factor [Pseudoxanthobacter soli]SHO66377.1 two component transcriptional regulator, LuxR family [Pseudoxanthobacter soli DSM 19599]